MKSALSLMLIVCLVGPVSLVAAQETTTTPVSSDTRESPTQGPIAQAITHEAVRLTAQGSEVRKQLAPNFAKTGASVVKGGLIGLGIGAVLGTTVGQEACLHSPRWHCTVGMGTMFGAIGAFIAWLH